MKLFLKHFSSVPLPNDLNIGISNDNNNNKSNLPNIWDLVDFFIKENPNVKYCTSYNTYYYYKNDMWNTLNKNQLTRLILKFLKLKYPKNFKKFQLNKLDDIYLLISQHEEFSMPNAKVLANANGFLLPFLNGVLNTKTLEFNSHSPYNYTTHIIPVNYSNEDTIINTKFSEFLTALVNNNPMRLKILRACLYLIITNNLIYQVALYIYGPGGTGKSTFINILMYLLGKDVTLSSSLTQINSRFGIASLIGKILLILNDISLYRGKEPQLIKNIIAQDPLQAEEKYKQPISFVPNVFTLMTSNVLWDIKHSTTGLARRMIYFPFDNVPNFREMDLFQIYSNGAVVGSLVPHLGGFINWILTCPQEYKDLLFQGGAKVTELISQDSVHVNPLHVFVKDCLIPEEKAISKLGSIDNSKGTLYGEYILWCDANGVIPISYKSFSILLIDLLKQQGWEVKKKRIAVGLIVRGVKINLDWNEELNKTNENVKLINQYKDREHVNTESITTNDFNN